MSTFGHWIRRRCASLWNGLRACGRALRKAWVYLVMAHRRHPWFCHIWAGVIPGVLLVAIYAVLGAYPFGDRTVMTLDLQAQYICFFEAFRDWMTGEGSLLYSFSRSLGGEYMGIVGYYLASPFSLLLVLFPKENITEAVYCIMALKCALCGVTFSVFLRQREKASPFVCVLFSVAFALIGYATAMQHNIMWFDNLYLLPLIVLGLWKLIVEKKYKLYTLSLALAVFSNFYIGYMTCIFVGLLSFFLYFSMSPEARNPRCEKWHALRAFVRVALFSVIALLIAALIILPVVYSLSFGKNDFSKPVYTFSLRFDWLDLVKQFLFGTYDTLRPEGLPIVYCGILTLLLLPCYLTCPRIRRRERVCMVLLCLILVFSFSINTLDMVWHGFQKPNWLNYRYSYMLCFLLVYMAAKAFLHRRSIPGRTLGLSFGALLFLTAAVMYFRYEKVDDLFSIGGTLLFASLYLIMMTLLAKKRKRRTARIVCSLLLLTMCAEVYLHGVYQMSQVAEDVGMTLRANYAGYIQEWQPVVDAVKERDDGFYRMEKMSYRRMNDPSSLGFRGLTASTSTLNTKTIHFLRFMGISAISTAHWSEYCFSSPVTDSVLGVKYVMDTRSNTRVSETYDLYLSDNTHDVYRNPYALPIAFCVSEKIADISFEANDAIHPDDRQHFDTAYSVFDRMNKLLTAMTGSDEELAVYVPFSDYTTEKNEKLSVNRNYGKYYYYNVKNYGGPADHGELKFSLSSTNGSELYAFFPSDYMRNGNFIYIGEKKYYSYFINGSYGTVYIGRIADGETKNVYLKSYSDQGFYVIGDEYVEYFYTLNEPLYREVFSDLLDNGMTIEAYTEKSFEGRIVATQEKPTVMTTIPYDEGWHVLVDGQEVETYEVVDALLAFDVGAGEHTISMYYLPRIYKTAVILFFAGATTFALIVTGEYVIKGLKKRKKR